MTLTLDHLGASAALAWRYTARPEWSSAGESMWLRLSKFSLCNRLSLGELASLFPRNPGHPAGAYLLSALDWKTDALASVLGIDAISVSSAFLCGPRLLLSRCAVQLRNCASCLAVGFHAAWFQWDVIERCPLHAQTLRTGCVACGSQIAYALDAAMASSPLACPTCRTGWVGRLLRPAGRCVPLVGRAARLMERWRQHVESALQREGVRRPEGRAGRVAPGRASVIAKRTHVLTLQNRHYDAPPPSLAELFVDVRSDCFAADPDCPLPFRPAAETPHWPHFSGLFRICEQAVLDARDRLLGTRLDLALPQRSFLLSNSLAAPADSFDCHASAALGWTIAWTSAARTLAPQTVIGATPALGLAAWLAYLPARPIGASPAAWQELVLRWLVEDMALSAWLWARLAVFMHAKGYYVLRTVIGHPELLAVRRRLS